MKEGQFPYQLAPTKTHAARGCLYYLLREVKVYRIPPHAFMLSHIHLQKEYRWYKDWLYLSNIYRRESGLMTWYEEFTLQDVLAVFQMGEDKIGDALIGGIMMVLLEETISLENESNS